MAWTKGVGRPSRDHSPAVDKALAWFREHGPESTLEDCAQGAGVSDSAAKRARRILKKEGALAQHFSPKDHGAGESADDRALTSSSAARTPGPTLSVKTLPEIVGPAPTAPNRRDDEPSVQDVMNDALERVIAGTVEVLTPEQSLQYASELVRVAPTFNMRTAALSQLQKLRSGAADVEELGPGRPLTVADRIRRAANILKACGRETALEVWARAFSERIAEVHEIVAEQVAHPTEDATPAT